MPKKYFRKPTKKNTRRRLYPKMSLKKRVLSIVKSQSEMKHAYFSLSNTLGNNINATQGIYKLEPDIPVGDDTFQREGNSIRLHKVEIVGYINWKPDPFTTEHASTNAVYNSNNIVRISVLKQRSSGSGTNIANNGPAGIFEWNNLLENSQAYTGTLQNSLTDFNKDAFICKKDMRIKMSGSLHYNPDSTIDIDSNSDMLKKVKYTMRFGKAGKLITYRTSGQNVSTNFPYFLTQVAHNSWDGTQPLYLSTEVQVKWYYTDN